MPQFAGPNALFEIIGVLGFALYVVNYTLLTLRILPGSSPRYFSINLVAAVCLLIGLSVSFNLAAVLIQLFWVVMSILGLTLHLIRPAKLS